MHKLAAALELQNSYWHVFWRGIVYGVAFFIGSAILAAILIGLFVHYIGAPGFLQSAFQAGSSLGH